MSCWRRRCGACSVDCRICVRDSRGSERARGLTRVPSPRLASVRGGKAGSHDPPAGGCLAAGPRSEEHTSELQSRLHLVCRLLLEKKKNKETGGCAARVGRASTRRLSSVGSGYQ